MIRLPNWPAVTTIFTKIPAALFTETNRSILEIQETHNCQKSWKNCKCHTSWFQNLVQKSYSNQECVTGIKTDIQIKRNRIQLRNKPLYLWSINWSLTRVSRHFSGGKKQCFLEMELGPGHPCKCMKGTPTSHHLQTLTQSGSKSYA